MIKWAPYIFVRLTFYLIIGIITAALSPVSASAYHLLKIAFFTFIATYASIYWLLKTVWNGKRVNSLMGLLGAGILMLSGMLITYQRTHSNRSDHLLHQTSPIRYYTGVIVSEVSATEKTYKASLEVKQIFVQNQWQPASGKILVYLDSKLPKPAYGDKLFIKGHPQLVPRPANPYEFNYRSYLQLQQIHHQHFIKKEDAIQYGYVPSSALMALSISIRQHADSIFRKLIPSSQEYAIATGLVLGIRSGLDNDIKQAYSSAGAMHVLAVSGAHVVIVFGILAFLLGFIRKVKYGHILFAAVTLCLLWLYAFITGLSASVLRAVVMFSFVVLAQAANRQTSIYNTLALSAFILLCYNPYLVFDVGFQLSYAAILGIVYLYPKIEALLDIDNVLLKYVWKISCASIAAQIATVPLSLFYFHQFPTYFLLANLFVIILSTIILYAGIATLALSWIPYVSTGAAFMLKYTVWALNQCVFMTEAIPGSLITGISITALQSFLLYLLIISFLLFMYYRKLVYWGMAFCFIGIFSSIQLAQIVNKQAQKQLAIYSVPAHTAVSIIEKSHNYFLADSTLLDNQATIDFHLAGHWRQSGVKQHTFINFYSPAPTLPFFKQYNGYALLIWHQQTFLFVHKPVNIWEMIRIAQPDYLVIQQDAIKEITGKESLLKHLIIDSTNKTYIAQKLKKQAQAKDIPCHITKDDGAFILSY